MPSFGPIKRGKRIACFRKLGYHGPVPGGKHEFMVNGAVTITIPNPHKGEIGKDLLAIILREAGISKKRWSGL